MICRLREVDVDDETGEKSAQFTPERVAELQTVSRSAGVYERLANAIGTAAKHCSWNTFCTLKLIFLSKN